jgi:hypothetical protein
VREGERGRGREEGREGKEGGTLTIARIPRHSNVAA